MLGGNELLTVKVIYHAAELYRQIVTLIDWVAGELLWITVCTTARLAARLARCRRPPFITGVLFQIYNKGGVRETPHRLRQIIVHLGRVFLSRERSFFFIQCYFRDALIKIGESCMFCYALFTYRIA